MQVSPYIFLLTNYSNYYNMLGFGVGRLSSKVGLQRRAAAAALEVLLLRDDCALRDWATTEGSSEVLRVCTWYLELWLCAMCCAKCCVLI